MTYEGDRFYTSWKWVVYDKHKNIIKMGVESSKTNALERAKYYRDNVR